MTYTEYIERKNKDEAFRHHASYVKNLLNIYGYSAVKSMLCCEQYVIENTKTPRIEE